LFEAEKFIRNLILNENNELKNRYLHINNVAIDNKNVAIEARIAEFNIQTKKSILELYSRLGVADIFGRGDISEICGISYSAAGGLISKMKKHRLIEEVKGYGKGKYHLAGIDKN
jgi:hypothetical protein